QASVGQANVGQANVGQANVGQANVGQASLGQASVGQDRGFGGGGGWKGGPWVGGVVTGLTRKYTKRGELMATFVLEDLESSIEVFVFPRTMSDVGHLLGDDAVVFVKGRLDQRDEAPKLICSELKRPQLSLDGAEPLRVTVPAGAMDDARLSRLRELLGEHPGGSPVLLHVGEKVVRLPAEFNVEASPGLLAELRVLLGASCLWNREVPAG
ncbi:MAG: OB-fold nucleic acid binding domain-containing protein, partial [Acidimicrobiales bacterium]